MAEKTPREKAADHYLWQLRREPGTEVLEESVQGLMLNSFHEGWEQAAKRRLGDGVHKMLILSTAHQPSSAPDFGDLRALDYEYGCVLFVSSYHEEEGTVPKWLQPIHSYAVRNGCWRINFDADAEEVSMFETFEW